ncbi:MAG: hypothetical protein JRF31_13890 [Deltaproteobacteria bacterium]|nr:hypothetical protein [Deltaproteobacteria bacterium]
MDNFNLESENDALDALMAAAFRLPVIDETSDEKEAIKLAANTPKLSDEDEAAIASLSPDFIDHLLDEEKSRRPRKIADLSQEISEAYAAMNRGNLDAELSEQTRQEIARKRKELLGEDYENQEK